MKISTIALRVIPIIAAGSATLSRLYTTAAHAMDMVQGRLDSGEDKKAAVLDIVGNVISDQAQLTQNMSDIESFVDEVKALYNVVKHDITNDTSVSGVSPDNTGTQAQ